MREKIVMKNRIIQECFWDYHYTFDQIKEMAESENFKTKKFIFEKILINSHDMISDLKSLFFKDDLKKLVEEYKVPKFNFKYINKRYLLAKYFLKGEKVHIEELEWKK